MSCTVVGAICTKILTRMQSVDCCHIQNLFETLVYYKQYSFFVLNSLLYKRPPVYIRCMQRRNAASMVASFYVYVFGEFVISRNLKGKLNGRKKVCANVNG